VKTKILWGTYTGSETFLEAQIVTPSGHDRVTRRPIQYNVHADLESRQHIVVWNHKDVDDNVDVGGWVSAIQSGDILQVVPTARWPAWINFDQQVEIDIFHGASASASFIQGH
jgi:hypothetical protein